MKTKEHIAHIFNNATGALLSIGVVALIPFTASRIQVFEDFLKRYIIISLQIWAVLTVSLIFIGISISLALWIIRLKKKLASKEAEIVKKNLQMQKYDEKQRENDRNNISWQLHKRKERIIR